MVASHILFLSVFGTLQHVAPLPPGTFLVRAACVATHHPHDAQYRELLPKYLKERNRDEWMKLRPIFGAADSCDQVSRLRVAEVLAGPVELRGATVVFRYGTTNMPPVDGIPQTRLSPRGIGRLLFTPVLAAKEEGYFFVRKGADGIAGEWAVVSKLTDLSRVLPFPKLFPTMLDRETLGGMVWMKRPWREDCDGWVRGVKSMAAADSLPKQREMLVRFGGFKNEALASWAVYALRTFAPDKATTAILRERLKDKKVSGLVVAATDMTLSRWLGKEWTDSNERVDRLSAALLSERLTSTQAGFLADYVAVRIDTLTAGVVGRKVLTGDPTDEGPMVVRQYLGNMAGAAREAGKANEQLVEKLFIDLSAEPYPKAVRDAAAAELKSLRRR